MGKTKSKRFKISEISPDRLCQAGLRRIKDYPHKLLWNSATSLSTKNRERINYYKDRHIGERCVIIGNGPSLKNMDLSLIREEITFGMNRIYLLFEEIDFRPTYFVSINDLVLKQFSPEISALQMPKFINWNLRSEYDRSDPKTIYIKTSLGLKDRFSKDISKPIYSGGTVTYITLQIAFFMGFSEVILIGIDHNFSDKGVPNKIKIRKDAIDKNHFHPQYFPAGSKWQLPDLQRSELAYLEAKQAYENAGRTICDATVDGKCKVFLKKNYYSIFD